MRRPGRLRNRVCPAQHRFELRKDLRQIAQPPRERARPAPARPPALQRLLARLRDRRQQHPSFAVRAQQAPGRSADVEAQSDHFVADQDLRRRRVEPKLSQRQHCQLGVDV
eukprot:6178739-Pleurochrysis_carterae.AAC.1